jgi:hypothetical protein
LNILIDDFGGGLTVLADIRQGDAASRAILDNIGFERTEPEEWFPLPPEI